MLAAVNRVDQSSAPTPPGPEAFYLPFKTPRERTSSRCEAWQGPFVETNSRNLAPISNRRVEVAEGN